MARGAVRKIAPERSPPARPAPSPRPEAESDRRGRISAGVAGGQALHAIAGDAHSRRRRALRSSAAAHWRRAPAVRAAPRPARSARRRGNRAAATAGCGLRRDRRCGCSAGQLRVGARTIRPDSARWLRARSLAPGRRTDRDRRRTRWNFSTDNCPPPAALCSTVPSSMIRRAPGGVCASCAALGEIGDRRCAFAAVMHQDAADLPVGVELADEDGQALGAAC